LRDFLPHETGVKSARILTYGYNTSVIKEELDPGKVTLESLSKEMLETISALRNDDACVPNQMELKLSDRVIGKSATCNYLRT
jgi:hypothetical protein